MDPLTILSLADGLLTLLEKLGPEIEAGVKSGTITVEQQKAIQSRAAAVASPASFSGPEWQPS